MDLIDIIKKDKANLLKKHSVKELNSFCILVPNGTNSVVNKGSFKHKALRNPEVKMMTPVHLSCLWNSLNCLEYLLKLKPNFRNNFVLSTVAAHNFHGSRASNMSSYDFNKIKRILKILTSKKGSSDSLFIKEIIASNFSFKRKKQLILACVPNKKWGYSEVAECLSCQLGLALELVKNNSVFLDNYPLIKNKFIYEKEIVSFLNGGWPKKSLDFFEGASLKNQCLKFFGTNSKEFIKFCVPRLFSDGEKYRGYQIKNFNVYLFRTFILLSEVFLKRKNPNISDFLILAAKVEDLRVDQSSHFLRECFTDKELVKMFSDGLDYDDSNTVIFMAKLFDKLSQEQREVFIKRVKDPSFPSFKNIKTFSRHHSDCLEYLSQPLKHFSIMKSIPVLSKIEKKEINGYEIYVAKTNHDLIKMGISLKHCVGNGDYSHYIEDGRLIIFSLRKNDQDVFTISFNIKFGVIDEAQGKAGKNVPEKVLKSMLDLLKLNGLIKERD